VVFHCAFEVAQYYEVDLLQSRVLQLEGDMVSLPLKAPLKVLSLLNRQKFYAPSELR